MVIKFIKRSKIALLFSIVAIAAVFMVLFFVNVNKYNDEIDKAHQLILSNPGNSNFVLTYNYIKDKDSAKIKTEYTRLYAEVGIFVVLSGLVIYAAKETTS